MLSAKCEWWLEWQNEMSEGRGALVGRSRQEWSKLHSNAAVRISHEARYNCLCQQETSYSKYMHILVIYGQLLVLTNQVRWGFGEPHHWK
jgi:hypothetical protein